MDYTRLLAHAALGGPARLALGLLLPLLGACSGGAPAEHSPAARRPAAAAGPVPAGVVPVTIQKTARGFQLLRGGRPYPLHGGAGLQQFAQLRAVGGNTVRLYSTDFAGPLLDQAQQQGLSVMLGVWLQPEGQYFSYYDPAMVRAQLERVRQQVLRYRRHPALLMWNVGNELELTAKGPRMYEAVNQIAHMIHELDPYHPVTMSMTTAFAEVANQLQRVAPEVDILSVNIYGKLPLLPALIRKSGWQGPYIVSEYGSRGYWDWEGRFTSWHAPLEQNSADKAAFVVAGYQQAIEKDSSRCLGGYVFYWGQKYEFSPTWLSLFGPAGEKTALVDELQHFWQHRYPANRAPHLTELELAGHAATDNVQLPAGGLYPAVVTVTDPEGDSLRTRWELLPDLPSNASSRIRETPLEPVAGSIVQAGGQRATVRLPTRPGPYRLYVRVFDGHGSMATANVPINVLAAPVVAARPAAASGN